MIFIVIGYLIRLLAIYRLGKSFWRIQVPSCLVKDGIYKYIRHPMYLGSLIMMWGIFDTFCGWRVAACLTYLGIHYLIDRIDREESLLTHFFGDEYSEYCKRTKRIIPFVF